MANEIYQQIEHQSLFPVDGPVPDYTNLDNLVDYVSTKLRRVAESKFLFRGIKRINPEVYQIVFEVAGHGVQYRDQQRVEQNVTEVSYDKTKGTIRITNYNIQSRVGGPRSWKVMPSDLDLYFFPSQDKQEIGEAVATRFRFY